MRTFCIDFRRLKGEARRIMSAAIQAKLFELGFFWKLKDREPRFLNAGVLVLNVEGFNPNTIWHTGESHNDQYTDQNHNWEAYNISDCGLESFLEKATILSEANKIHVMDIDGVSVTITKNKVELNASALLSAIEAKAQAKQKQLFPSKE